MCDCRVRSVLCVDQCGCVCVFVLYTLGVCVSLESFRGRPRGLFFSVWLASCVQLFSFLGRPLERSGGGIIGVCGVLLVMSSSSVNALRCCACQVSLDSEPFSIIVYKLFQNVFAIVYGPIYGGSNFALMSVCAGWQLHIFSQDFIAWMKLELTFIFFVVLYLACFCRFDSIGCFAGIAS